MKTHPTLSDNLKSAFAAVVIPVEILLAIAIYVFLLGNPENFQGNDPANHPLPGNYLGIVYKGGYIVPVLISLLLMVLTFGIERILTISRAKGKGNVKSFVRKIKTHLSRNNVTEALAECDQQKGSVANVVKAGLTKYGELAKIDGIESEKKVIMIQKDI